MTFDFDLFVIGGGSGGVRAARIAAGEHGARVALAEESRMGGTCVIRGCVPKKLMIFASQAGLMAEEMRGYGWEGAQAGRFDWPVFRHKLDAELTRLELIYTANLEKSGVQIFHQRATIVDDHTVALADGTQKTASTSSRLVSSKVTAMRPPARSRPVGLTFRRRSTPMSESCRVAMSRACRSNPRSTASPR